MSLYLHDIPLDKARERFIDALKEYHLDSTLGSEEIPIDEFAVGRILAEPVWAIISSPHYHASAMDGFALISKSIENAMPTNPISLLVPEQAVYLDTGDVLPDWANCVVPIENIEALDENGQLCEKIRHPYAIRLRASLTPWSHIRPIGEDIVATELVLPIGKILRPVDLGAAAASGQDRLVVVKTPLVSILPTGTELVPIGTDVKKGDIIEYNSVVLGAQIIEWGGKVRRYPITIDDFGLICENVKKAALDSDLILLNAGSSAGAEDFSSRVVETLGELCVHGIAVRPGHPVILGMIHSGPSRHVPIIGVPGYPVSAAMTGEIFVKSLIYRWNGKNELPYEEIEAKITKKITSPAGDDDYVRILAAKVGGQYLAAPLSRGAGVITSLVKADGFAILPRGIQGIEAGEKIKIHINKSVKEIENTILVIGSHDLTIDVLAEYVAKFGKRLVSSNVGSLGGLLSLSRGESHFGGSHLLDLENGSYNFNYVKKYLTDFGKEVVVVNWVFRDQGFIVQKGNPKDIHKFDDLVRNDITFINRQRGAGTRVLLDYELGKIGIQPEAINGYDHEEFTHLAVAASIGSGRADIGLGVASAAKALKLDFIPLFKERFDFVFQKEIYESDLLKPVRQAMRDSEFKKSIQALVGYDTSSMGSVMVE